MQLCVCGIFLVALIVAGTLVSSLLALAVGAGGLVGARFTKGLRRPGLRWTFGGLTILGGLVFLLLGSQVWRILHSLPPLNSATMDDPAMEPFLTAINKVDRASLGFTPIPPDAQVQIERALLPGTAYDVMLHIYADTSRTIAFREEDGSHMWIGEQEIHTGPHQYVSADGVVDERIVITYYIYYGLGVELPLNTIHIHYYGEDPRLSYQSNLTLQDVQPILEEWRPLQTPTPHSLYPAHPVSSTARCLSEGPIVGGAACHLASADPDRSGIAGAFRWSRYPTTVGPADIESANAEVNAIES